MPFAENLKLITDSLKMSNYKLAQFIGCSQTSVANWISGERIPRKKTRLAIAELFGISLEQLDGALPENFKEIALKRVKNPASVSADGKLYPAGYDRLTPENRKIVDRLIADLANNQSAD